MNWAKGEAEALLRGSHARLCHVGGVAARALALEGVLSLAERDVAVAACYLHDIGYSERLSVTGLHQLDGALYLRGLGQERLARLVAHHSCARFELECRGYGGLLASYPREESLTADVVTYCDVMTDAQGRSVPLKARIADIRRRYGSDPVALAMMRAAPLLALAVRRIEQRVRSQVTR